MQAVAESLGAVAVPSVRASHLCCTNVWVPVADCAAFNCLGSTEEKLFQPQAGITVPDCIRSSVERRAVFRISISCSCRSALGFPRPVSPAACWFGDIGLGLGALVALLNSDQFLKLEKGFGQVPMSARIMLTLPLLRTPSGRCGFGIVFSLTCHLPPLTAMPWTRQCLGLCQQHGDELNL